MATGLKSCGLWPVADRASRLARLASARLYLCMPLRESLSATCSFADAVLAGGVDLLQLRHKSLEWREEQESLLALGEITRRRGALLSANDRADLTVTSGADILHVGQDDLPPRLARRLVGPDVLLGQSTHDERQLEAAIADPDVDYFCVGPVWETPTKEGRPGVGLGLLRTAAELAPPGSAKPWFVTGGVAPDTLDDVLSTGARRVVVVRALTGAADPGAVAAELSSRLAKAT
jgi:thiamine-phosphate pyrophosphorylase